MCAAGEGNARGGAATRGMWYVETAYKVHIRLQGVISDNRSQLWVGWAWAFAEIIHDQQPGPLTDKQRDRLYRNTNTLLFAMNVRKETLPSVSC